MHIVFCGLVHNIHKKHIILFLVRVKEVARIFLFVWVLVILGSMGCFSCFSSKKSGSKREQHHAPATQARDTTLSPPSPPAGNDINRAEDGDDKAKAFTFRELATATKNFRQECLLGEGGIGRVYKGKLQSNQIVAVRQLDRAGTQGSKEFQAEVVALSQLHHPNLVKITGYCGDGDQRLVVYEYLPLGGLENQLFDVSDDRRALDWSARMKIATGVAQALEFLHETANPPIIYRDLKTSNILLDATNNPKLSEYGLAKLLQSDNKLNVSPRVMSSYGYCAPEYDRHGEVSVKSDVYSYGVVLLELITGRRAFDASRPQDEQTLVTWAQSYFRDPKRYPDMVDPLLGKEFPVTSLNQAVGVASMCLQEEPSVRPFMTDIVAALSFLVMAPPESPIPPGLLPILSSKLESTA